MPTIEVQLSDVRRGRKPDGTLTNNVSFTGTTTIGGQIRQIVRQIDISKFDTWEDFAKWLIVQEPEFVLMREKEKLLEITFHAEDVVDPETGIGATVRVLDDVTVLT